VSDVVRHDAVFRLDSDHAPATAQALFEAARAAGVTVSTLSIQSTTLDDVFVHYAGRALRDALQAPAPRDFSFMRR
jgi:hypothetical protein